MNKLLKVFAIAAILILSGQAMAQNRSAIFLSASFPMKEYAEFDRFYGGYALTTKNANEAGADLGYNVGYKWYLNFGVKGLSVLFSVDGFYNGPTKELKDAYHSQEGAASGPYGGSFRYTAIPKYVNVPAMLGLNYIYHFNSNLGMYVEAGAGGNLRFITDMESVTKTTLHSETIQETQDYDNALSFAYQAGIGFEVAKKLIIGCSFYDLGGAIVSSEHTFKKETLDYEELTVFPQTYGTIHPIMVLARIGFTF